MPCRRLPFCRAFVLQWWTAGVVLFYLSVRTAYQASHSGSWHDPHLILVGGGFEALAALLFLVPRTMGIAAAGGSTSQTEQAPAGQEDAAPGR